MPRSFSSHLLFLCLFFKSLFLALFICYSPLGLGPDEAQYWTWSQALDWGYYSKPPGIAWQIGLGTGLFGSTEWGVRSMSLFLGFLQAFAVYSIAQKAGLQKRSCFWCGLFMAFSPLGILGAFLAITDGGFLLCWTGACGIMIVALAQQKIPSPFVVGGWVLVGALFKWPIYFFWIFFTLFRFLYFKELSWKRMMGGVIFSLIGLFPSVWWNIKHDWATFRHVLATMQGGSSHQAGANIGAFLGAQMGLVSPVLFICLLFGVWQVIKNRQKHSPALFFCAFVTMASLCVFSLAACVQKIQGNWTVFAYPTGWVILGWFLFEQKPGRKKWAAIGLGGAIVLTSLVLLIFSFNLSSYRLNPFKHQIGWKTLEKALDQHGYQPENSFLVSDKYQTASLLSFYSTGQKRAYFLNLQGIRKNQFSYWPSLQQEQKGKTGFFVWVENRPYLQQWQEKLNFYQTSLKNYFEKVEYLEMISLVKEGEDVVKGAFLFRCCNCVEHEIPDSFFY